MYLYISHIIRGATKIIRHWVLAFHTRYKPLENRKMKTEKEGCEASLVAQWLRIRLPIQGTQVRALVREDPTCREVTKPVRHNN